MTEAIPLRPDEYLDELHWVFSYHVGHLGRMAGEMDRLSLLQAARDFRQSVATWDRLLGDIEQVRGTGGGGPSIAPNVVVCSDDVHVFPLGLQWGVLRVAGVALTPTP
jgi:hypothetical protein